MKELWWIDFVWCSQVFVTFSSLLVDLILQNNPSPNELAKPQNNAAVQQLTWSSFTSTTSQSLSLSIFSLLTFAAVTFCIHISVPSKTLPLALYHACNCACFLWSVYTCLGLHIVCACVCVCVNMCLTYLSIPASKTRTPPICNECY